MVCEVSRRGMDGRRELSERIESHDQKLYVGQNQTHTLAQVGICNKNNLNCQVSFDICAVEICCSRFFFLSSYRWTCFVQLQRLHLDSYLDAKWIWFALSGRDILFAMHQPLQLTANITAKTRGKERNCYRTTWIWFNSTLVKIYSNVWSNKRHRTLLKQLKVRFFMFFHSHKIM